MEEKALGPSPLRDGHLSSPSRSCLGRLILIRGVAAGAAGGREGRGPAGRAPKHLPIVSVHFNYSLCS